MPGLENFGFSPESPGKNQTLSTKPRGLSSKVYQYCAGASTQRIAKAAEHEKSRLPNRKRQNSPIKWKRAEASKQDTDGPRSFPEKQVKNKRHP